MAPGWSLLTGHVLRSGALSAQETWGSGGDTLSALETVKGSGKSLNSSHFHSLRSSGAVTYLPGIKRCVLGLMRHFLGLLAGPQLP